MSGFRRFIDRLRGDAALRGEAPLPDARFRPPPAPPPSWHAVRDDLEQTLDNLRELRDVLTRYQAELDALQRRAGAEPGAPSAGAPPTPSADPPGTPRSG